MFSQRAFFDSVTTTGDGFVYISGTLTGEGIGYKNNSTVIACYKDGMECMTYIVEQIGENQIGRLEWPDKYRIEKWNKHNIVAANPPLPSDCSKTTITIERETETALWVNEPTNQTDPYCKSAETRILKWTIEDSPAWKALTK